MRSIAKQVQDKHKRVMRKTLREHNFMSNPTFLECKFSFKLLQVPNKYSCFYTLMAKDRFQTCRLMENIYVVTPLRRVKVWTCVWMPETLRYPKFLERQWQFVSCEFVKSKLLFLFFMNPLSPLEAKLVHASPPKRRRNPRFKPNEECFSFLQSQE